MFWHAFCIFTHIISCHPQENFVGYKSGLGPKPGEGRGVGRGRSYQLIQIPRANLHIALVLIKALGEALYIRFTRGSGSPATRGSRLRLDRLSSSGLFRGTRSTELTKSKNQLSVNHSINQACRSAWVTVAVKVMGSPPIQRSRLQPCVRRCFRRQHLPQWKPSTQPTIYQ